MIEIKPNDSVRFLYYQHLTVGICVRVNKKSITVRFLPFGGKPVDIRVPFHRIAHEDDLFTVVWERDVGVEGRYYIDFENYPNDNGKYSKWYQPFTYVVK